MDASALTKEIIALEVALSSFNSWLLFWVVLVVVGIVVEFVVAIEKHFHELKEYRPEVISSQAKPSDLKLFWNLFGTGLVAIGIAGELGIRGKAGEIEAKLQHANAQLVALVNKSAQEARTEGERLKTIAENERLARIKLEAFVAPRRITPSQQSAIGAELSGFSGRKAKLYTYLLDPDGALLGEQIGAALKEAGIPYEKHTVEHLTPSALCIGIHVTGTDIELAAATAEALSSIGKLTINAPSALTCAVPGTAPLNILVGVKPIELNK